MSTKRKKRKSGGSLILTCIGYFVIFSLLISGVFIGANYIINAKLNSAFPSSDDLLQYEDYIRADDFMHIPASVLRRCEYIVYDGNGRTVYATSHMIADNISAGDAVMMNDYKSSTYYVVYNIKQPDGSLNYQVFYNTDSPGGSTILDSCVLDGEYNIIEGTLFAGKEKLTKREFGFLRGRFSDSFNIEKYDYVSDSGEERTLIMAFPVVNEKTYYRTIRDIGFLWFLVIPVILVFIIIGSFLFAGKVRKSVRPLDTAIRGCRDNAEFDTESIRVPREFRPTVESFSALMTSMRDMQREKDDIYREKQRVIADISHDLKTPLTVMQGYAGAFIQGRVPPEKQDKYHEIIYNKSKSASELIDTLFEYTHIEHPDFALQLQTVDICEYTKELTAEKYGDFEDKHFNVETDIPDEPVLADIDIKVMRRVYENLIQNALKYNPEGTTVLIAVKCARDAVELRIADNGTGIPAGLSEHIFDEFVTGDSARSAGSGTGLGLAIARKIVKLHGGVIRLSETPQSPYKTEFVIFLPRHTD